MINGHTPVGSPTNPPNQFFRMYGATLDGVFGYQLFPLTGTTNQTISIEFTTASTAAVPNPVSDPVLVWGGHIASQLDWGLGTGASSISGSPYHMGVTASLTQNGNNIPIGSPNLAIAAGAVTVPTIIIVNKVANPTLPTQNFNFTNTNNVFFMPGQPDNIVNSFSLDGSNTFLVPPYTLPGSSGDNVQILETTNFGTNQITETVPTGWTLTGITIRSRISTPQIITQPGPTANLRCVEGDALWVTFTDQFAGSSSVVTVIQNAANGTPLPLSPPPGSTAIGSPGVSVFDTARVDFNPTGGPTPTGTVTYTFTGSELAGLTAPAGWTVINPTTWEEMVTLNANGTVPRSAATGPLPPGSDYVFTAAYSGNYGNSISEDELLIINKGSSSLVTTIMAAGGPPVGTLGGSVFDTATLTVSPEGTPPTGTVTYTFTGAELASLTAPSGWTVVNPTTWTDTVMLVNGTVPNSALTPALPAGSYQFTASYSGDNNYAASPPSAPEPLTIRQGISSTATVIMAAAGSPPIGTLGGSVFDTATVTGSSAVFPLSGTVTYTFTGAALASLTPSLGWTVVNPTTWTDTVTLVNGTVPDSLATPALPAGSYQFTASYSGDGNYSGSTSVVEPLTINKGNSSTATVIMAAAGSPPLGTLGGSVFDTATVTGSATGIMPTGDVTYTLTGAALAGLTAPAGWRVVNPTTWEETVTLVNGTVPDSSVTPALPAGSYQFTASYSGDDNYHLSTSGAEPLTISRGTASAATVILAAAGSPPLGTLGGSVFDTATVTGSATGITPTGDVTYTFTGVALAGLTPPAGWTVVNSTTWTNTVTLTNGLVPDSAATPALPAGSYHFTAFYSGDGNYTASLSADEPLTISRGTASAATVILAAAGSPPLGTLGGSVFDTATVTGSATNITPTGTVTYEFFHNGTMDSAQTVTLVNGAVPDSAVHGPLAAGSYSFVAVYSGDGNYAGFTSAVEPLTISQGSSSLVTTILSAATGGPPIGTLGESVFDTATVTGSPAAFPPSGTVTYTFTGAALANLTAPAGWTVVNATTWTDTVTLNGNGTVPDSAATPALPTGSYQFTASYSGDNNYAASPPSAPEPLTIRQETSSTATVIMAAAGGPLVNGQAPLGTSVFDTATVTSSHPAFPPRGTVTYTLTGTQLANLTAPSGWTVVNATTWEQTVTLNADGTVPDSALTPALRAGSYQFTASYSGNSNYSASPPSAPEPLTINQGTSVVATEILDAATSLPPNGVVNESVFDTATVTVSPSPAAFTPTGTVTYEFFNNGTMVSSEQVTLNPNGTVPPSAPTDPLAAGSYSYIAIYSGDNNYAGFTSAPEPLEIGPGSSNLVTAIMAAGGGPPTGALGESVFDTATLTVSVTDSGATGVTPTGDVTYTLTGSALAGLTAPAGWTVVNPTTWTDAVTLNADGTVPDSLATPALPAGSDYVFTASYSGDNNYHSSTSADEPLIISRGTASTGTVIMSASGGPPTGALGESVFDTATVTGSPAAFPPSGTVTYTFTGSALAGLTAPTGWTVVNATTWEETVTLTNGLVPDSAATPALPAGSYHFTAFYSGDGNYTASLSADEPLTISHGTSSAATVILAAAGSPPLGTLGGSVFDTATVTGSSTDITPTGTVTYEFFHNGTMDSAQTVTLVNGTVPDSAVHGPLAAGSYSFVAVYSGDGNYAGFTSAVEPLTISQGSSSTATVIMAASGGPPSGAVGESVVDTATVTGSPAAFPPSGTVTYTFTGAALAGLIAPTGWTVVNATTWEETVTLNANGTVPDSTATPALRAGSYQFTASYSGDGNYAASPPSAPEPLTINKGTSSTTTAIMVAAGASPSGLGESVFDTATVTGSPAAFPPSGTVIYTLTGSQLANLTAPSGWTVVNATTWEQTVTLNADGTVPDSALTPALRAGSYQFTASYSGDGNYTASDSGPEPLTINQGISNVVTTILDAATSLPPSGALGESVLDTATVTGSSAVFPPSGTVTYTLTGAALASLTPPAGWTVVNATTWTDTVTLNANGTVPDSAATPPLPAGSDYVFTADYSGDNNYHPSTSAAEPPTIRQGTSSTATVIMAAAGSAPIGTLGGSVFDTATATGSATDIAPTGTVTYIFTGSALAGLIAPAGWTVVNATTWEQTVTLNADGTVPDSAATPALPAGGYQFTASYSGDKNYAASPPSAPEPLTINKGTSSTATVILAAAGSPPSGTLGGSVLDTATVTGSPAAFPPSGTVTYTLTGAALAGLTAPAGWTVINATTWEETVTLNANGTVPDSTATPALPAGSDYVFTARYSGDDNYQASTSGFEPLIIHAGSSTTATLILDATTGQPPTGTAGESVLDTATVTISPVVFTPTGTVTYFFTGPELATLTPPVGWTAATPGATTWTQTVGLNANGTVPDSTPTPPLPSGNYLFLATYSGDNNYTGFTSDVEPLTIGPVSPILATTPNKTVFTLGDTPPPVLTDTATLSGGFNPTGTITFNLYYNYGDSHRLVHTEMVTVDHGNGTYTTTTGFTLPTSGPVVGTYLWVASYSGDDHNNPAFTDTNADEEIVTVLDPAPTLTTIAHPTTVTLGSSPVTLTDTATLSGGFFPTGNIIFRLIRNGDALPVFVDAVNVNGNGSYTTTATLSPSALVPGTYQWVVVYGGDPNNDMVSDSNPADEQVTVIAAPPPPEGFGESLLGQLIEFTMLNPGQTLNLPQLITQSNQLYGFGNMLVFLDSYVDNINPSLRFLDQLFATYYSVTQLWLETYNNLVDSLGLEILAKPPLPPLPSADSPNV